MVIRNYFQNAIVSIAVHFRSEEHLMMANNLDAVQFNCSIHASHISNFKNSYQESFYWNGF